MSDEFELMPPPFDETAELRVIVTRLRAVCKDKTILLKDAYAEIERVRAERDGLLAALKYLVSHCDDPLVRATIAKVEGGK